VINVVWNLKILLKESNNLINKVKIRRLFMKILINKIINLKLLLDLWEKDCLVNIKKIE
jgi:hypothetical protein